MILSMLTGTGCPNINKRELSLLVTDDELNKRKIDLKPFKPKFNTGTLAKYSRLVSSASEGAIFKTKEAKEW